MQLQRVKMRNKAYERGVQLQKVKMRNKGGGGVVSMEEEKQSSWRPSVVLVPSTARLYVDNESLPRAQYRNTISR